MIKISQPYFNKSIHKEIKKVINSGWVSQGPVVSSFEKIFANKYKLQNCMAVNSCTSGLELIGKSLGIGKGDEVIVPSFTWISSANFIENLGAKPVFVDIELSTFNIDTNLISNKISKNTKAILGVHLFGHSFDYDQIKKIINERKIHIIEDAACALGTKYKNKFIGNLGSASSFSFHPRKSITTGEGGMVSTKNKTLAKKINSLRNHGSSISEEKRNLKKKNTFIFPDFTLPGHNHRMTDLQGVLGVHQLKFVEKILTKRKKIANYYTKCLANIDWIILPEQKKYTEHSWQSYVLMIDEKILKKKSFQIMKILEKKGISTRFGTHAIHTLHYYKKKYGFKEYDYPLSLKAMNNSISLPLHYNLTKSNLDFIIKEIKKI